MAEQTQKKKWENPEIGAAWSKIGAKSGEKYLSGIINLKHLGFDRDVEFIGFKNKGKGQNPKAPDLRFYLSTPKNGGATLKTAPKPTPAPVAETVPASDDDQLI